MRNRVITHLRRKNRPALHVERLEDRRVLSAANGDWTSAVLAPPAPAADGPALSAANDPGTPATSPTATSDNSAEDNTVQPAPADGLSQPDAGQNLAPADQGQFPVEDGQNPTADNAQNQAGTNADSGASSDQTTTTDSGQTALGDGTDGGVSADQTTATDNGQIQTGLDSGQTADGSSLVDSGTSTSIDLGSSLNTATLSSDLSAIPVTATALQFPTTDLTLNHTVSLSMAQAVQGMMAGNPGSSDHGALHTAGPSAPQAAPDLHTALEAQQREVLERSLLALTATVSKKAADPANTAADPHTPGVLGRANEDEILRTAGDHGGAGVGHAGRWSVFDPVDEGAYSLELSLAAAPESSHGVRLIPAEARPGDGLDLPEESARGADLLTGQSAADRTALDLALQDFVRQLGDLGQQLGRSLNGLGVAPWVLTAAMAATAFEVTRRRRRPGRPGLCPASGDAPSTLTWFGGLLGSVSTEQA